MTLKQVGRYRLKELIGRGGMGEVYRAFDPQLNREVIIKFINLPGQNVSDEWRLRFQREVQAAGSLNHPNIVTIYDVDLDHDPPYVVMELLTGGSLKDRLRKKQLSWQQALTLFRPLADALAYAHQAGLIHRDVKPENVIFADKTGTLKLVDFGLARQQDEEALTKIGTVMGTPAYMSPEQARGEEVDGRTDIFALGIMLYEALAGRNPQSKGSLYSTIVEVQSDTQIDLAPLTRTTPPDVIKLVGRAVAKDRDQRYPTCEKLLADWDVCLGNLPEQNTPTIFSSVFRPGKSGNGPEIRVAGDVFLSGQVRAVLKTMFGNFGQVAVETEFHRGFSESHVFRIRLVERKGKTHLPAVVKIAPIGLIQKEWQAYQTHVEHTLPNIARLEQLPTLPSGNLWGGLRYALVGGGTFKVQSLYDYYNQADTDDLLWVLEKRLFAIMGPNWWWDNRANRAYQMQSDYDNLLPINLLIKPVDTPAPPEIEMLKADDSAFSPHAVLGNYVELSGFIINEVSAQQRHVTLNRPVNFAAEQLAHSYRIRLVEVPEITHYQVGNLSGTIYGQVVATRHDLLVNLVRQALGDEIDLSANRLPLPIRQIDLSTETLPNPLLSYPHLLQKFITVNVSTVHGDLNLENILIDPDTREVSLIDFATVRQGHALHDLLRLETEVVIKLIPPALAMANIPAGAIYLFYKQLHQAMTAQSNGVNLPLTGLDKPFRMLQAIRKMAHRCMFNADDWQEYYQGLVLYLLGALKFKNVQQMPTAPLPSQVAFWGATTIQHLLETLSQPYVPAPPLNVPSPSPPKNKKPKAELESPFGTMRPESRFYIERDVDGHCWKRISATNAITLFIQAPRQMGKSSLMRRVLAQAKRIQYKFFAFVDFQKFPEHLFDDEENFLIEFCLMIGDSLDIPEKLDQFWQGRRTNIRKCSLYLSDYVLPQIGGPLILAMDEVERMLTSPFRANFFGMLRTWHNDRVYNENFAQLTLFLSSSTEPYLFIDNPNQSPFNVAEVFSLEDFTQDEVEELNRRHNFPLTSDQVGDLMGLIGGHPFLTRLSLYLLATRKVVKFDNLLSQATDDAGPFSDHIHHYLLRVWQKPELKQALTHICREHTHEENQIFYRLKGSGLIKRDGKRVILRNNLYDRYFKERLNDR